MPVVYPTVATVVVPLIQVPPPIISLKVVVAPMQTLVMPLIGAGAELTVIRLVAIHPVENTL